jgi:hypothetical protein
MTLGFPNRRSTEPFYTPDGSITRWGRGMVQDRCYQKIAMLPTQHSVESAP